MRSERNGTLKAVASGAIGATTVTLLHESVRRLSPQAPRMDVLGMRGLARMMRAADVHPPNRDRLHFLTLLGEIISNGAYYSLVGAGRDKSAWSRGVLLGLGAGVGGVVLPPLLGLGSKPSARTTQTKLMTVAWYLAGGIAAAAASRWLTDGATER